MARYEGYELGYQASAAQAVASERAAFVRRVYGHLAGAVLALVAVTALLVNVVPLDVVQMMFGNNMGRLLTFVLFIGAGFVARMWAQSQTSVAMQYAGLALYVCAWAVIFLPVVVVANIRFPGVLQEAGILTGAVFGGLTLSVFVTRKDYSFLGPVLSVATFIALGVILCAMLFGFSLGLLFCFAMVALISGYILYDTSNVMLHYPTNMHVAASLELLADVALLFLYIVQILMSSNSRD
jgi:FtsH-binding integral membrane protein